jgi:uncharacterized protein YndB with AHSA1/START domain
MNIRSIIVSVMAPVIFFACSSAQKPMTQAYSPREQFASVTNTVSIEGAPEAVFDLVTTARFWTQWHPATHRVGGVTERPYGLGDRIEESGRIGRGEFQVTWRVVEHVRPRRVLLQAEGLPTQITYSFHTRGKATEFTRELKYKADDLRAVASDPGEVNRLMRARGQSIEKPR